MINLTISCQNQIKSNLRNAYYPESKQTIQTAIDRHLEKKDYFSVGVLIELLREDGRG